VKALRRSAMPRGSCDPSPHSEEWGDHRRLALSTRGSSCCQGSTRATSSRASGACPIPSREAGRNRSPKSGCERAPESARNGRGRPPKRNHLRPDSMCSCRRILKRPRALHPGRSPVARPGTEVPEDAAPEGPAVASCKQVANLRRSCSCRCRSNAAADSPSTSRGTAPAEAGACTAMKCRSIQGGDPGQPRLNAGPREPNHVRCSRQRTCPKNDFR
jgi:hypothetical protein